jgi:hypothetical protein
MTIPSASNPFPTTLGLQIIVPQGQLDEVALLR